MTISLANREILNKMNILIDCYDWSHRQNTKPFIEEYLKSTFSLFGIHLRDIEVVYRSNVDIEVFIYTDFQNYLFNIKGIRTEDGIKYNLVQKNTEA